VKAALALTALLVAATAAADQPLAGRGTLLDHFVGDWIMTGTIAGQQTTHDITAGWILEGHYLRFHELARETDPATGQPAYEAIVILGWDEPTASLACLWLDTTGGGGLTNGIIGRAEPRDATLAWVFAGDDEDGVIHNTWTYHRGRDAWSWVIDIERGEERSNFAMVELTRP
jgi:hypothetical protein